MRLHDILRYKGTDVFTISPEATLDDVVQQLVACNCGSLVVAREEAPRLVLGIVTERDILRACAKEIPLQEMRVEDAMSRELILGSLNDDLEATMGLMTRERIRHLPVVEDGQLVGLVSIGDVVKAQHDRLTMEYHYMMEYIQS